MKLFSLMCDFSSKELSSDPCFRLIEGFFVFFSVAQCAPPLGGMQMRLGSGYQPGSKQALLALRLKITVLLNAVRVKWRL